MQASNKQQTDLNAAIFRVALLLFFWISVVYLSSFYSPNKSPDIADTAVPCYLHGEALCWFPCRYFSLTHPAKLGEPGGRLIAWCRYCRHITCLQLCGHKGSTSLLGADGESRLVLPSQATARYPPQVGSQRMLHALPGRKNGFSLHRLNLPDYAPSPSVISPPPRPPPSPDSIRQGFCQAGLQRAGSRPWDTQGEHFRKARLCLPAAQAAACNWEIIHPAFTMLFKQA